MDLKRICLYMILPPLLVSCGLSGGSSLEEDLIRLDRELDSAAEYLNSRGITETQEYEIYGRLYDEYSTYNFNKAVEMLQNQERLAMDMGSDDLLNDTRLEKAKGVGAEQ